MLVTDVRDISQQHLLSQIEQWEIISCTFRRSFRSCFVALTAYFFTAINHKNNIIHSCALFSLFLELHETQNKLKI